MVTMLSRKQHAEIGSDISKIMILILKIKDALANRKSSKRNEDWCQLNLQNHYELITQQFRNVWKHLELFNSNNIRCCTSWSRETSNGVLSHVNSCFNSRKGKVFCIVLYPVTKSGYTTIILSIENRWVSPARHQHPRQSQISKVRSICSSFGGISSNWPKLSREITINYNWCVWADHWRKTAAIQAETQRRYFITWQS